MKRLLFVLLLLAAGGSWLIAGAGHGLRHAHVTSAGVPLDEVHPAVSGRHPGVVVAHGYAGSAKLMAPFGDTLAARGYVVVLLDFAGHGASTRRLPNQDSTGILQHDLDVALAHLRSLSDVDASKVALVGHSMGAGAVTRYAGAHPEVTATVAISLPDAADASAGRPARLLTMAGALEFPAFRSVAGSVAAGHGDRALRIIPGVEHITILYAPETHRQMVKWLDDAFGGARNDHAIPFPARRLIGTVLLMLAFLLGFHPLVAWLSGTAARPWPRCSGSSWRRTARIAGVTVVAAVIGAVFARLLPSTRLPLAIAGYVVGYATVTGALLFAYASRRSAYQPESATGSPRLLLAVAYAITSIAVPVHWGMTHAWPAGDRWWLLVIVWAAFAVLAYGSEKLSGGVALNLVPIAAVFVVVLVAAAVTGLTSGFVLLVLVPLIGLLLWQALWSAFLHRFAAPTWAIAVTGAVVVAWPLALTLPLAGP